jgi:hypothetical protein
MGTIDLTHGLSLFLAFFQSFKEVNEPFRVRIISLACT